ncbi:MAG: UPF0179 family protein [Thermofilaceae archaeon]
MVTEAQAKVGTVFKAMVNPKCIKCPFYKVCAGTLRSGGRYKVKAIRRKAHTCPLLNERMVVIEVEEMPALSTVESKLAVEGLTFRYKIPRCERESCLRYLLCNNTYFIEGEQVKVVAVHGKVACPENRVISLVELVPLGL